MDKLYAIVHSYDNGINIRAVTKNFDSAVNLLCDDVWESILSVVEWYGDSDDKEDYLPKSREEIVPGLEWNRADVWIYILPSGHTASLDYGSHSEEWSIAELPTVME